MVPRVEGLHLVICKSLFLFFLHLVYSIKLRKEVYTNVLKKQVYSSAKGRKQTYDEKEEHLTLACAMKACAMKGEEKRIKFLNVFGFCQTLSLFYGEIIFLIKYVCVHK